MTPGPPAPVELDHLFVMCDAGAPELASLRAIGLDGPPRCSTHPGQGTANACVVFENAFLELLWVHDEREARAPLTAPTRLWDRWAARRAGACPFGIGTRPGIPCAAPPFATWPYRPAYMPPGLSIDMATGGPIEQPEVFFLSMSRPRPEYPELVKQHALRPGPITSVTIELPGDAPLAPACAAVEAARLVSFARGAAFLLRLGCGAGAAGRADLRPALPIVLDW